MSQYYTILAKEPHLLHRFYAESSTLAHADDDDDEGGDENGNESMCLFGLEISNSEPVDPDLGVAGNFSCPGRLENGEQVAACFAAITSDLICVGVFAGKWSFRCTFAQNCIRKWI